jgi:hypothetical protein
MTRRASCVSASNASPTIAPSASKHEQKGEPAHHCGQVAVSQKLVKPKLLPELIADMNWASLAMLLDGDTRRINSNQCAHHCGEADGSD